MDYVRSCYKSSMRPYRDQPDIVVPGQWHFCLPGAKRVPYPHVFGSTNWDPEPDQSDADVGELHAGHTWANGAGPARNKGLTVCGTARDWSAGAIFVPARPGVLLGLNDGNDLGIYGSALLLNELPDPDNIPPCCHAEPPPPPPPPWGGGCGYPPCPFEDHPVLPCKIAITFALDFGCPRLQGVTVVMDFDPGFNSWYIGEVFSPPSAPVSIGVAVMTVRAATLNFQMGLFDGGMFVDLRPPTCDPRTWTRLDGTYGGWTATDGFFTGNAVVTVLD